MAQLRHDYQKFKDLNTEILVMVPNGPKMIDWYVTANHPPYPILVDKGSRAASLYTQKKILFSMGTPTVFLVDKSGTIMYAHYAFSPIEEPDNREPLAVLAQMSGE